MSKTPDWQVERGERYEDHRKKEVDWKKQQRQAVKNKSKNEKHDRENN